MPDFLLPDLGEGLDEAEVLAWHVGVGDTVAVDQIVVEVETAKAAVEVPVPFAGTVTELHAAPGTTVRVGQPLISVARVNVPPVEVARVDGPRADEEASGNVLVGFGTAGVSGTRRHRPGARSRSVAHRTRMTTAAPGRAIPVISPLVRKLARDADVDLAAIVGTGPSGTIRRHDIDQAVQSRTTAAPAQELPAAGTPGGETRIPLRGPRRTVAEKVTRSRREIPEATVWVDVDATELLAARAEINANAPDRPVGLLALIARFTVLALRHHPELNAHIENDEIVIPDRVHLGFAAQTERGLVVPVVPNAHGLSTRELSAEIASRTAAARAGKLGPAELTGGTITVNNYGVFGVDGSAAIINHPEVAIVGIGRIIDRPWVVDGQLTVRKIGQLTLAFDHRVCDGGTAGGFLRYIADRIEKPITALAEL
jgi:pyruvate dehydrogenase E2 component (dihydrolipoamide acetyltransferase)